MSSASFLFPIIDMVIGFLINGRLVHNKIETMSGNYKKTGFGREIMHIIQPTPNQRELIAPIFKEYAKNNNKLLGNYNQNQLELYNELKESLQEVLDEEQIKRLDELWNHRKRRFQHRDSTKKHKGMKNRPARR